VRDDPATCVDQKVPYVPYVPYEQQDSLQRAVVDRIADLGECAKDLPKPVPVLARVRFRADGKVAAVSIPRAGTSNCRALDCVRRHLAQLQVPAASADDRTSGADFMLRAQPRPDGNEKISWNRSEESRKCTDDVPADPPTRSLPPERVIATIAPARERFRACYEQGLAQDAKLEGRVVVQVVIDPNGKVTSAEVIDNQLPNCTVSACVRARFSELVFPTAEKATTIVYPLLFAPG
jgi:TonB family protein